MKVRCITDEWGNIAKGKEYHLLDEDNGLYKLLIDDEPIELWYHKKYFEKVGEQMETQPITMDNLAKVLEFNGYKNVAESVNDAWEYWYMFKTKALRWDKEEILFGGSLVYFTSDLDLFLIALERQGIKLNPLPIEPKFDFISCLIESGYFQICELDYYTLSCEDQLYIQTQEIEHTKENADRLIQIAKLFKEVK